MLWIAISFVAAAFQTARNALQRGLIGEAGPWGATLVRFLFGLPLTVLWLVGVLLIAPHASLRWSEPTFWVGSVFGALLQVLATAAVLLSMRASSFAVGTVFTHASLPAAAIFGLGFGDALSPVAWIGVAVATSGLVILSWPKHFCEKGAWTAAIYGLGSGVAFGLSGNAFRQAGLAIAPGDAVLGGAATLVIVQTMQSIGLSVFLAAREPHHLGAALRAWRRSLGAGFCGAAASLGWFTALGLAPAAAIRAVGVVDMPMAAIAGRRFFKERMSRWHIIGAALTAIGVVGTALGV
jgi:drug/metabolite transporter (DMT)-like permease